MSVRIPISVDWIEILNARNKFMTYPSLLFVKIDCFSFFSFVLWWITIWLRFKNSSVFESFFSVYVLRFFIQKFEREAEKMKLNSSSAVKWNRRGKNASRMFARPTISPSFRDKTSVMSNFALLTPSRNAHFLFYDFRSIT